VRSSATYNASRTGVRLDPPARGRAGLPQPPAQAANPDATLNQPGIARRLQVRHESKAIILGNLALAHIRQRDVGQAAAVLNRAIDVLEVSRGGGGLNMVSAAVRELRPWRHEPVVQDVNERLHALMTRNSEVWTN
jgi:hypothetical protein